MKKSVISVIFLVVISFNSFAQSVDSDKGCLQNLDCVKKAIIEYYNKGQYDAEMSGIINKAISDLNKMEIKDNSAFVFDIDETALSNLEYEYNNDFSWEPGSWNKWLLAAKAPAIKETKRFYDSLISKKIKIVFITGRDFPQEKVTKDNLLKVGFSVYDTLITRSAQEKSMDASVYKLNKRKALEEKKHYYFIGNIGDQLSDLEGDSIQLKIKLPNYIYFIP
ncbi:MAG: HAD family acid phosphatase [Bacteroidota bacterium]